MITVILEVSKQLFKYCILLQTDFQTHVLGYPNTYVWISNHAILDLFFTGYQGIHVTQIRPHNWLITSSIIISFRKLNHIFHTQIGQKVIKENGMKNDTIAHTGKIQQVYWLKRHAVEASGIQTALHKLLILAFAGELCTTGRCIETKSFMTKISVFSLSLLFIKEKLWST